MADFRADHDIVTKFLLSTCKVDPLLNYNASRAFIRGVYIATRGRDDETEYIPMTTGSTAELYIQPMLSCVGDTDIMVAFFSTPDQV